MSQEEEIDDFSDYITSLLGNTGVTQLTKRKRKCTKTEEEKKAKRKVYNQTMRNKLKANNSLYKAEALDSLEILIDWAEDSEREELTFEDMANMFKHVKKNLLDMRFPY
jgi:tRNA splicing endonuclease